MSIENENTVKLGHQQALIRIKEYYRDTVKSQNRTARTLDKSSLQIGAPQEQITVKNFFNKVAPAAGNEVRSLMSKYQFTESDLLDFLTGNKSASDLIR